MLLPNAAHLRRETTAELETTTNTMNDRRRYPVTRGPASGAAAG